MITSRRDYLLRMIDEIGQLVARAIFKRRGGADREALELVVQGFERLFNMERDRLFQFTPEQQRVMLTLDEPPENARDKLCLYAALSAEAGELYLKLGNAAMSRATLLNALTFALAADEYAVATPAPSFAPTIDSLVATLRLETLDAETRRKLANR
jgi:hypothetical protein